MKRTSERWSSRNDERRLQIGDIFETEGSSGIEGSSGQMRGLEWPGVADAPDRTLGVVEFSREALGSLDACHHP